MTKDIVVSAIKEMPQEFELDQLFERLAFIEKIEAARKEIEDGKGIPLEEIKQIIKGWQQ